MDALLGLLLAILVFVVLVFLIQRSVKTIIFLGVIILALMGLTAFGVLK